MIEFFKNKKNLIIFGIAAVAAILTLSLGFFFLRQQKNKDKSQLDNLQAVLGAEAERDKLVKKVSELVVLPPNEVPAVATITDKNKLQKQLFYSKSDNGDKVLIYKNSKMVVLYRPSSNKIINIATGIPIDNATPTPVPIKIKASPAVIFRAVTPEVGESTSSATQLDR